MPEVMLRLGDFRFAITTAAYDSLSRQTAYSWPSQVRLWNDQVLQYVGRGEDTLSLKGAVYPHFQGGLQQIAQLRQQAYNGQPLDLVTGYGEYLGRWAITQISEEQDTPTPYGAPLRQVFGLSLSRYGEDAF